MPQDADSLEEQLRTMQCAVTEASHIETVEDLAGLVSRVRFRRGYLEKGTKTAQVAAARKTLAESEKRRERVRDLSVQVADLEARLASHRIPVLFGKKAALTKQDQFRRERDELQEEVAVLLGELKDLRTQVESAEEVVSRHETAAVGYEHQYRQDEERFRTALMGAIEPVAQCVCEVDLDIVGRSVSKDPDAYARFFKIVAETKLFNSIGWKHFRGYAKWMSFQLCDVDELTDEVVVAGVKLPLKDIIRNTMWEFAEQIDSCASEPWFWLVRFQLLMRRLIDREAFGYIMIMEQFEAMNSDPQFLAKMAGEGVLPNLRKIPGAVEDFKAFYEAFQEGSATETRANGLERTGGLFETFERKIIAKFHCDLIYASLCQT